MLEDRADNTAAAVHSYLPRISLRAFSQNSMSRPCGQPLCSHRRYARSLIACSLLDSSTRTLEVLAGVGVGLEPGLEVDEIPVTELRLLPSLAVAMLVLLRLVRIAALPPILHLRLVLSIPAGARYSAGRAP